MPRTKGFQNEHIFSGELHTLRRVTSPPRIGLLGGLLRQRHRAGCLFTNHSHNSQSAYRMEVRSFARHVIECDNLEEKLSGPKTPLTDNDPGTPLRIATPGRPSNLMIASAGQRTRVPSLAGMQHVGQRAKILHALANHELQAAELFAWALLAFPSAPVEFRSGLVRVLFDEQRHCRMYIARLNHFGRHLGDYPVTGYFWNKIEHVHTPIEFVCAMSLTFENANLDHSLEYAAAAEEADDAGSSALFQQIHADEIEHVRFGWTWLLRLKDRDRSPLDTYKENVAWPLRLSLARGTTFHSEGRRAAGLDDEFVEALRTSDRRHDLHSSSKKESRE